MNIREALAAEHSKRQTMAIVEYVGADAARFAELMEIFLGDEYRPTQRASWAVNYCAQNHPELVGPYLNKLILLLERDDVHNAVLRNVARLLQFVEIPGRFRGRVFDACSNLVDDATQPVAVRVFAMTVAAQIAKNQPELLNELRLIVDKHAQHTTIAFRVRANRVLSLK
jgi:hypothetical protein